MFCANQNKTFIVIFFLFFSGKLICQPVNEKAIDPIIKSFLVPGWGQSDLGYKERSKIYNYIEIGILLSMFSSTKYSNEIKRNYIAYATEHAGVISDGKDREFWVDIGNYNTLNEYNSEHLRNRDTGELYPQTVEWRWSWDNSENRKYFESKRIQSDKLKLFSTFTFGALFLNHFISSIDALYLKRLSASSNFTIKPYIGNNDMIIGYKIEFSL
tara:strand:+ start:435 stop:1076 length:642 start_codon:yes stop_codon:yes gene_type:complete